jgi:polysaccharide biosynthesis/export protein
MYKWLVLFGAGMAAPFVLAQEAPAVTLAAAAFSASSPAATPDYVLGPDDVIRVWMLGVDEAGDTPVRIDSNGWIALPLVGRIQAGGLTTEQLTTQLIERLKSQIRNPQVSVSIADFGSQPATVLGAVNSPGVHQLRGRKTLAEVLALAGGLRADAGSTVRISRPAANGVPPLPAATLTPDGKFEVTEIKTKEFLDAKAPQNNFLIQPYDVITVPVGEVIYVIGAVVHPGAFPLNENETISTLQALSLAQGLATAPSPGASRILRSVPGSSERKEIPLDLKKVMAGKGEDIALLPDDILFVPTSNSKKAGIRAIEAAIYATTGVIIWR